LDTDYKHLSREERQQRDADQASSLKRQTSLTGKPKTRSADVDLPFANDRYKQFLLSIPRKKKQILGFIGFASLLPLEIYQSRLDKV